MKKKMIIIFIWILIWQGLSGLISNSILFAGPYETAAALWSMLGDHLFYLSIGSSILRIMLGILAGAFLGTICGAVAYKIKTFKDFIGPFVSVIKSIPVASFIIIILIWTGNKNVSFFITALVSFPLVYIQILNRLLGTDKAILELAACYKVGLLKRIRYIYLKELREGLRPAMELAIGMGFKSGTAAEVIGQPLNSIGNNLYRAKINLDTDRLFAWTVTIVVISYVIEKVVSYILKKKV